METKELRGMLQELLEIYEAGYEFSRMLGLVDEEVEDIIERTKIVLDKHKE